MVLSTLLVKETILWYIYIYLSIYLSIYIYIYIYKHKIEDEIVHHINLNNVLMRVEVL